MLVKILLLGLAIWLLFTVLKRYKHSVDTPADTPRPEQDMVRCAVCEIHLPKSESIERDGRHYCCIEHSQQDAE